MANRAMSSGKIAMNSFAYAFSGMLINCFSLFLLPLYTSYLSTSDYGVVNLARSFANTMGYVLSFSLFSAVMRFYVDLKEDKNRLKQFYGSVVVFVFLTCSLFAVLAFFARDFLSKYIFGGIDFFPTILVCVISLIFGCQHTIYDDILKSQQKAWKSSILSILYFLVTVSLNVLFVVKFRMGPLGPLLSTAISAALYTAYFLIDMISSHEITFCLNWGLLKSALKYSIPIMPHNLSTTIAVFVSNLLIGSTDTLAALGVYSVASQFGKVSETVQGYVNKAYGPWLYEKLHAKEERQQESLRGTVGLLTSVIGLFFIGISLFAHDYIVLFTDKAYVNAWMYVPLIVMVFAIKMPYYFYVNILFYHKKASRLLFTATLTSSFVNVILSAVLIPLWGAYGSIFSDALSIALTVAIIYIISRHYEDIGLRFFDFVKNIVLVAVFIGIGLLFTYTKYSNVFFIGDFLYRVGVVLIYMTIMYFRYRKIIVETIKDITSRKAKKHGEREAKD